jgi:4-hydroxy-tetrahydrodipicolinate synthase
MFSGAITALITPFKNGKVDAKSFQNFVQWQVEEGVHGLVCTGTTGESPTLSYQEHQEVIELCVEAAQRKVPVIAGTGSNSTDEAISMAIHAKKAGVDGLLLVTPYYNKPSQEGMFRHFKAIHDAVELPLVLYNIPGRSVVDLSDETIARLAKLERIVGIKDATGDLARVSSLRMHLSDPFTLLSGEDATALAFNAQGGEGVVSVTSNVAPRQVANIQNLWNQGNHKEALAAHEALMPLHQALFSEVSPQPVKYAASLLGKSESSLRLPLIEASDGVKAKVEQAMQTLGLI